MSTMLSFHLIFCWFRVFSRSLSLSFSVSVLFLIFAPNVPQSLWSSYHIPIHRKLILVFISKSAIEIIAIGAVVVALHLPWHWFYSICYVCVYVLLLFDQMKYGRFFLCVADCLSFLHSSCIRRTVWRVVINNSFFFILMSFVYKKVFAIWNSHSI